MQKRITVFFKFYSRDIEVYLNIYIFYHKDESFFNSLLKIP